jgi:hypothetical protein
MGSVSGYCCVFSRFFLPCELRGSSDASSNFHAAHDYHPPECHTLRGQTGLQR